MEKYHSYNKLEAISALHCHIENMLDSAIASVYWKDKKGKYLGLNTRFTDYLCGSQLQPSDIVGKTDRDFIWVKEAPFLEKNDQEVICTTRAKTIIEPCRTIENKIKLFLSHKSPLRSRQGKIIGVLGISYYLDGNHTTSETLTTLGFSTDLIAFNLLQATSKDEHDDKLTPRQIDCLYFLVKGFTVKQIAKQLALSPRTVEHYLEAVKVKLDCYTRADLISKSLQIKAIKERL